MTSWVYNLQIDELRYIACIFNVNLDEKRILKVNGQKVKLNDRYHKYLARYIERQPENVQNELKREFEIGRSVKREFNPLNLDLSIFEDRKIIFLEEEEVDPRYTVEQRMSVIGSLINLVTPNKNINKSSSNNDLFEFERRYRNEINRDLLNKTVHEEENKDKNMEEIIDKQNKLLERLELRSVEIIKYQGKKDKNLEKFIKSVETSKKIENWNDSKTVKNVIRALNGKAYEWIVNKIEETDELPTWEEIKEGLKKEFGKTERMLNAELQRIKQGEKESVRDFYDRTKE